MIRFLKDLILRAMQVPADIVAALLMEHPAFAGKFFPFSGGQLWYVLPKKSAAPLDQPQGLPVPPPPLWEGYGPTLQDYLEGGRQDMARMLEVLKAGGYEFSDGDRVLELGCAAGRMLRWLNLEAQRGEVWGADINAPAIVWCQQWLSPPFHFLANTTTPHLPFSDAYFNLVYAGSVFSHVADLADAWLLELGRVLAPGGRLFVTICDHHTIELLTTRHPDLAWTRIIRPYLKRVRAAERGYEMFTIRRSPTGAQVFYDPDFFVRKLDPVFRVISVTPQAYGLQTGVMAEKKAASPANATPEPNRR